VQFGESKYVGDPLNAVRIFNEKQVDELIVLDIEATARGKDPDEQMISNLAAECRMPLATVGELRQ
jgi:cyclase